MLHLRPTEVITREANSLLGRLRVATGPVNLVSSPGVARHLVLRDLAIQQPEAVTIQVCESPDQIEYALLSCAEKLGPACIESVDDALRSSPETLEPALALLDTALGERPLFVDGVDLIGSFGSDSQLASAMSSQVDAFHGWLRGRRGVQTSATGHPDDRIRWTQPPVQLSNGRDYDVTHLWRRSDGDVDALQLALQFAVLEGTPELRSLPPSRQQVAALFPDGLFELLSLLSHHARPLARGIVEVLGFSNVIDSGLRLGLWLDFGDRLVIDEGWSRWLRSQQNESARIDAHRRLAAAFARELCLDDPSAACRAPAILEAFRHYIYAGDLAAARNFARHGTGLLVGHARELSRQGQYHEAAQVYSSVLEIAAADRLSLSKRMVAYARHYEHFNRARPGNALETIDSTIRGYEASLDEWPENALFWSRLVRAYFYADKPDAAFAALARATEAVPAHPQRDTFLVARTAGGLLEHERKFEAALIWGAYEPTNEFGMLTEQELLRHLAAGWQTQNLRCPDQPHLFFSRRLFVRVERRQWGWDAELPELDVAARAQNPRTALSELSAKVRDETAILLRTLTHQLEPETRLRKRLLLGAIDICASRISQWRPEKVWVFGELERGEDQRICFRAHDGSSFPIPKEVLPSNPVIDGYPRFARLMADERGWPRGVVLELDEPFRREPRELWDEWQRRTSSDGQ